MLILDKNKTPVLRRGLEVMSGFTVKAAFASFGGETPSCRCYKATTGLAYR